jgi:hypothetical protein
MYGYINAKSVNQASSNPKNKQTTSLIELNTMLDMETNFKKIKWCKIITVDKIKKLNIFIDKQSKYNDNQKLLFKQYVRLCINRKRLIRDKEVKYNIENGEVEEIIGILYNESSKKFTISSKSNIKTTKKNKPRELLINSSNAK